MTVSTTTRKNSYTANGSTTVFAYGFKIFNDSDLKVYVNSVLQTIVTHYTVSGAGTESGGNVTFGVAPLNTLSVVIIRTLPRTQATDYVDNSALSATSLEDTADKNCMLIQEVDAKAADGFRFADTVTDAGTITINKTVAQRASKLLSFDAAGDLIATQEIGVSQGTWAASTAYEVRDIVRDTGSTPPSVYICLTAHTSSGSLPISTNTDSAKWRLITQDGATGATGAGAGIEMTWETATTDSDQGAGKIWVNNSTPSSATVFYVDDVDANAVSINSLVDSWDDSTNLNLRGTLIVKKQAAPENYHIYNINGVVTSASTYSKIAVDHIVSAGTIADGIAVNLEFVRTGDRGPNAGLDMIFETATTDTDQGAGKLWLNHGTVSSATVVYLDDVDDNSVSINSFVDSFDDSSSGVKGHIQFEKQFDPAVFAMFNVTGSVTSASTYSKVACTYVTGAGSFSDGDKISTTFIRGGDKGDQGVRGNDFGLDMTFESTTTDTDQGVGKVWFNNGTLSSASVMYMDDVDANSASINAYMDSWDDSTHTALRGTVKITKQSAPANFAIYNVTGSVTSASTYSKIAVTYVTGAGSFTDADAATVAFTRTGDSGGGLANVVEDTSPELGANLDTNSFEILFDDAHGIKDDSGNEQLIFSKTGSATNYLEIGNATADPDITAAGSDSNVGISIAAKGTGVVQVATTMNPTLTSTGKALVLGF
jgi:hypothetical protein